MARSWRESASLIVLSKFRANGSAHKNHADYKVLLVKRPSKASFMANSYVFPGGVAEKTDESPLWAKYFKSFGVSETDFKALSHNTPDVFKAPSADALGKDISLRITAIREAFEEVGLLLGRRSMADLNGYGTIAADISETELIAWQQKVHKDPLEFHALCEHLKMMPDLWGLHRWSSWLTPSNKPKRFATAFYLLALDSVPQLVAEKHEVADYTWKTPFDALSAFKRDEVDLPPPQFYELSRLLNKNQLDDLKAYAQNRPLIATPCMLPVQYQCTDGIVGILPGDDQYPVDPNAPDKRIQVNKDMNAFRMEAAKWHRYEYQKLQGGTLHLNFQLNGELNPVNINELLAGQ